MKHVGKLAVWLAGALALSPSARCADATTAGGPYATVITRNIFGLNPPAPAGSEAADATPPPKITPNGIMSIFGQLQVLFKVTAPAKTGGAAGDQSYIHCEGQRQDDIEVIKIDEKAGVVTFDNHGETQELPLVATAPSSTPSPGPAFPGGVAPGSRLYPGMNIPGGGIPRPRPPGYGAGAGAGAPDNGSTGPMRAVTFNAASQIPEGMTPEVQTIAIEANRELTKQQVINGDLPPLPITEMTPSDAVGAGGAPLAVPAPESPAP